MKKLSLLLMLLFLNNTFATNLTTNTYTQSQFNSVQLVRLNFTAPNGASRELLLGFTSDNSATDGVDYGYDASVSSPFANDLNWMIENDRYVIQGVGAFDDTKKYPFGLYTEITGNATIELTSLESFDSQINVFIYDSLLNTYTNINDSAYTNNIDAGQYTDRFYIAFNNTENALGIDEFSSIQNEIKISYNNASNSINFNTNNTVLIKEINFYDYTGKQLQSVKNINKHKIDVATTSNNKSVIIHITTENKTILKQIVIGS